jgi:hypothetical protein
MNDTILLFTGTGVFSLMLIAIVLTVLEFRQVSSRRKQSNAKRDAAVSDGATAGDQSRT